MTVYFVGALLAVENHHSCMLCRKRGTHPVRGEHARNCAFFSSEKEGLIPMPNQPTRRACSSTERANHILHTSVAYLAVLLAVAEADHDSQIAEISFLIIKLLLADVKAVVTLLHPMG